MKKLGLMVVMAVWMLSPAKGRAMSKERLEAYSAYVGFATGFNYYLVDECHKEGVSLEPHRDTFNKMNAVYEEKTGKFLKETALKRKDMENLLISQVDKEEYWKEIRGEDTKKNACLYMSIGLMLDEVKEEFNFKKAMPKEAAVIDADPI